MEEFSRRDIMAAMAAAGVLLPGTAFAANPVIPQATIDARKNAPVIAKKVNKLYNLTAAGVKEPNDMQFAPNGQLWILDQVDPNHVATIDPKTGKVLANVVTECIHGSGITYGDDAWFLTSTKVITGNPSFAIGGNFQPKNFDCCSVVSRLRAFVCEMIGASGPKTGLLPV